MYILGREKFRGKRKRFVGFSCKYSETSHFFLTIISSESAPIIGFAF